MKTQLKQLHHFYHSDHPRTIAFRRQALLKLAQGLIDFEAPLLSALKQDLGKSPIEAYASEIGFVQAEIRFALKHLKSWTRPQTTHTPLLHFPAKSIIQPESKGVVLIIGPWNYPVGLLLTPLVGAIAAGNCVVLKPSEHAPHTAKILQTMIQTIFTDDFCQVHLGDAKTASDLLTHTWDHIFFTGSSRVGQLVMSAAAKTLSPVTLELGGKNPCIVLDDFDLKIAAERIVWGKFLNAGQTCVAPDHVYISTAKKAALISELGAAIKRFYGPQIDKSPAYGRIVHQAHFQRLREYRTQGELVFGGKLDEANLFFPPTLLTNLKAQSAILDEEIFGPILPILPFDHLDTLLYHLQSKPKPLALYLFTKNKKIQKQILNTLPSGTAAINDTLNQITTPLLPLGGIGQSGMGQYHGKASFDCFTHYRAILHKSATIQTGLSYPPYKIPLTVFKKIYRWFLG